MPLAQARHAEKGPSTRFEQVTAYMVVGVPGFPFASAVVPACHRVSTSNVSMTGSICLHPPSPSPPPPFPHILLLSSVPPPPSHHRQAARDLYVMPSVIPNRVCIQPCQLDCSITKVVDLNRSSPSAPPRRGETTYYVQELQSTTQNRSLPIEARMLPRGSALGIRDNPCSLASSYDDAMMVDYHDKIERAFSAYPYIPKISVVP